MELLQNTYIFLKAANLWYDVDMKIIKHKLKAVFEAKWKTQKYTMDFFG